MRTPFGTLILCTAKTKPAGFFSIPLVDDTNSFKGNRLAQACIEFE